MTKRGASKATVTQDLQPGAPLPHVVEHVPAIAGRRRASVVVLLHAGRELELGGRRDLEDLVLRRRRAPLIEKS